MSGFLLLASPFVDHTRSGKGDALDSGIRRGNAFRIAWQRRSIDTVDYCHTDNGLKYYLISTTHWCAWKLPQPRAAALDPIRQDIYAKAPQTSKFVRLQRAGDPNFARLTTYHRLLEVAIT